MILSIVVAIALDGAIGRGNDLLWHLPADLKRFKELTTGHTILMGRKTFDSLPRGPLPNRRNIVVSRSLTARDGVEVYPTIEGALKACKSDEEVFIIGGGEIYRQLLPHTDRIYLTRVQATFPDAEVFFPELDPSEWSETASETFPRDEKNEYDTTLHLLQRRG
ncbi:dihydrofolate reductase [Porphyromonas sp.]|uniref:dihydrofolate reductase n=1 Tax=Porphyromonas sp. TaxID=1924944 RepID=UPI001CB5D893|nr:dihydrofolate reductase [Porphyromonas sp.]MBF1381587.1 dihydrofolate reductase [Porphyromonas sp.]